MLQKAGGISLNTTRLTNIVNLVEIVFIPRFLAGALKMGLTNDFNFHS